MSVTVAFIGFGEAGQAFATGLLADVRAFDIKTDDPATREAKRADYASAGVAGAPTLAAALSGADLVLSVVTADKALAVARAAAPLLIPGALYCDMNSVAPATKRAAAGVIEAAGGRYADVAVMSPVLPARRAAPLLVSGDATDAAWVLLADLGFDARALPGPVGRASTVKMLRSVLVKGLEALTVECFGAAARAGVTDEVRDSLAEGWPGIDWAARAAYNGRRMTVHGLRRAAEMDEVAATLEALGVDPVMTRAAARAQRAAAGQSDW